MKEYHGGQDNSILINFKQDFSVTTNFIGPNLISLDHVISSIVKIE